MEKEKKPPKVGAIIVTYKPDLEVFRNCIESLIHQCRKLYVVDNTPNSYLKPKIFNNHENLEIIYLGTNRGIACAQNVGIKKALEEKIDYILISDQDTVYPSDFVEKMMECFKEKNVAAAGPLFVNMHTGKLEGFVIRSKFGFKKIYPAFGKHEVFHLISSGTIINATCLNDVGLMMEKLFIDWIDMEWCWRAIKKGYKIVGNADVTVQHRLGDSAAKVMWRFVYQRSPTRSYYITRNAVFLSFRNDNLDLQFRCSIFLRSFRYLFGFPLFVKPRLENLKYTLKGFYHGVIGKMGKLDETP
ncbi:MAG: glycosyltransferase family 2 protein [Thermodesulforhabdaceae bacterium]